jgi:beta-carotene/zeaxanthin 4-ketolase
MAMDAGVAVAVGLLAAFLAVWYVALFRLRFGRSHWLLLLAAFFALEFLYTGLFITTHDAMHGAVAPSNPRLNDFLGMACISLYAWFDYEMLHKKHWQHHDHTGVVDEDPDFHGGATAGMLPWFARFMATYLTVRQLAKLSMFGAVLATLGAPLANQATYMAGAGLASAFRLFYFGTYEPHRPRDGDAARAMPWEDSASSDAARWVSFLKCYHFDYHREHHRWPDAPWWMLPVLKQKNQTRH